MHLERFACKLYRDTKTSTKDRGVDLSTNFGVIYQIKKMKISSKKAANSIVNEIKGNFDKDRIEDKNIVVIIDDINKEVKHYLINMKIQTISKTDILNIALQFEDEEDRIKVCRIIYEEYAREYGSDL